VDGRYSTDPSGNSVYAPRDQTELDQIKALVRSAIGFDEARGDQVEVVNMQFAERPDAQGPGTEGPGLFDFTRDDLINWAQMGVTLIISLALVFFVMRPLLKRALAPEERAPLALTSSAEIEPGLPVIPDLPEEATPPTAAPWVNGARAMGEAQLETLKSVGQLVDENPKQAALIVRDWLSSNSAAA